MVVTSICPITSCCFSGFKDRQEEPKMTPHSQKKLPPVKINKKFKYLLINFTHIENVFLSKILQIPK